MEGIQKHVDLDDIINTIENVQGISSIHDLHVWSIISGQNALSCHAVVDGDLSVHESQELLRTIENKLDHKGIGHVTIQMENNEHPHDDSLMCQNDQETTSHNHEH